MHAGDASAHVRVSRNGICRVRALLRAQIIVRLAHVQIVPCKAILPLLRGSARKGRQAAAINRYLIF